MSDSTVYRLGIFFVVVIPCIFGAFAIAIPFISYRATKKDRFVVVGALNALFCGLAILALVATAVVDGYPSFAPYIVIAGGFSAMLIFEAVRMFGK